MIPDHPGKYMYVYYKDYKKNKLHRAGRNKVQVGGKDKYLMDQRENLDLVQTAKTFVCIVSFSQALQIQTPAAGMAFWLHPGC